jgi:hypothetical protein
MYLSPCCEMYTYTLYNDFAFEVVFDNQFHWRIQRRRPWFWVLEPPSLPPFCNVWRASIQRIFILPRYSLDTSMQRTWSEPGWIPAIRYVQYLTMKMSLRYLLSLEELLHSSNELNDHWNRAAI